MAVVPLSRMTTVTGVRLYTASSRAGIPEWRKVESPMVATTGPGACLERTSPMAIPMLDPMARVVSMAARGSRAARV